ncbi:hypothetical protein GCM10010329_18120 [Streptomyces spiroverticillatus]|uniref:Uncharacterized protein n=1 Tax=Streptomyces finlayi TaxID=67296 RepID=A0A918WTS1_9ACTN|nr:hypothetical protein GCM10010329_18120 [Streptomyces spiroverticillatus]GHC82393.1 hypothetical protein GCM10010334_10600 [Streptomyces finlayi]
MAQAICVEGDRYGLALALVELLHGQTGEGEDADADQDQQGGEDCLKHGVLLGMSEV